MRIARFSTGDDPAFGVVTGEVDEFGTPADDAMVVALNKLTGETIWKAKLPPAAAPPPANAGGGGPGVPGRGPGGPGRGFGGPGRGRGPGAA